jgi:hypothetical protein
MNCYRCNSVLAPGQTTCRCGQAAYTTYSPGAGLSMGRRIDGGQVSQPSPKDFIATSQLSHVPSKVDLRTHCSAVEDQGQIGSCIPCAVVGAMEYQERKAGKPAVDLSRLFVYFNARRMRGSEQVDSGVSVPEGLAAFLAFGAPPESAWPYDPQRLTSVPGEDAFRLAREHTPTEYARVEGQKNIRGALAQEFPVPALFQLPLRCLEEAGRTGVMPVCSQAEFDEARGKSGHAMLLVGYDLDSGTYLVRNSWGAGWGDSGYCRVPFDVVEHGVHPASTWILGRLDGVRAMAIERPVRAATPPAEGGVRDLAAKMRTEIRDSLTKDIADSLKDIRNRVNPPRQG